MNQTTSKDWNVLIVKPKSEKKVGLQLKELGFESCVPVQKQVRQWSDRKKIIESVLFFNYVFVETSPYNKSEVFNVGNVLKYLKYMNKRACLKPKEVSLIKQLSGLESVISISYEKFVVGNLVKIVTGPLREQIGTITAKNGKDQIQLSLPSLNCFANVVLNGEKTQLVK
ncbi:MAG: UpxY family transcription antiterminator [Saprospiraceae bacterium]|nr:UpxY family transcription antiterminator [Saprospiraceae bacterium]